MNIDHRTARLSILRLIELIRMKIEYLPDEENKRIVKFTIEEAQSLADNGEEYIAFELLVSNLHEISFPVTREIYQQMEIFSLCWPTPPEDYRILCELIVDE